MISFQHVFKAELGIKSKTEFGCESKKELQNGSEWKPNKRVNKIQEQKLNQTLE